MDPALAEEFALEAADALQKVEQDLLALERTADPAAVGRIFRALHSVKGSAAFLGLTAVEKVAHAAETYLDLIRQGRKPLTPAGVDALLQCRDALARLVQAPGLGAGEDPAPLAAPLEALVRGDAPPPPPPFVSDPNPTPPARPAVALAEFSLSVSAESVPITPPPRPAVAVSPPPAPPVPVAPPVVAVRVDPPAPKPAPRAPEPPPPADDDDKLMKVRVRFLDDLLQLTGNMVMARNQLLSKYQFADDPAFLTLSQCVTQVHKTIVQTRMQPVGALFDRAERQARDLARQLGKEVALQVAGRDLELDRSVLDAFSDPLSHLVRNALDHGFEPPAERQRLGKPRGGTLKLSAREQSGEVVLTVEDDGGGIDPERVKAKAVARGLLTPEKAAAMTPRAALDLIFRPGFSTRDEVTSLSGRGVGLDVVRTNLEALGGVVEATSSPGAGSAFVARLPLAQALVSSSLIAALVVTCGGERYAVPQAAVDEIIKVDPRSGGVRELGGQLVYQLRDAVLPVVPLERVLRPGATPDSGRPRVLVVVQFRRQLFGLLVDRALGVEEIVVRPMPALVKRCRAFSGHTVMGDGRVAMILDAGGIIESEGLDFAGADAALGAAREAADAPQRLVVFNFAEGEYFAIPLEMVSLIEKVPLAAIKRVGPNEFIQVASRTLPLLRLDKVTAVGALGATGHGYLLVPARVSYPIAVLAGREIEVVEVAEKYESRLSDGRGMLGTFVHRDRLIVLLDLYKLFERHSPERFRPAAVESRPAHLLLAEDSPFFQNLVRSYLESPPRRVTVAADGRKALDLLEANPGDYDLLVSDIEMPNMDGFELVRRVRSDPRLRTLPVVAVTSLATPAHIERGLREGFDSYLVKIDKEQLIQTIDRHLERGARHRAALAPAGGS